MDNRTKMIHIQLLLKCKPTLFVPHESFNYNNQCFFAKTFSVEIALHERVRRKNLEREFFDLLVKLNYI